MKNQIKELSSIDKPIFMMIPKDLVYELNSYNEKTKTYELKRLNRVEPLSKEYAIKLYGNYEIIRYYRSKLYDDVLIIEFNLLH